MPLGSISPENKLLFSKKVVIPIVGVSSVGKNSLMDTVVRKWPDFHRASGVTTRLPRYPDEDSYRSFLPPATLLDDLLHETGENQLVQYGVHSQTGSIYGTTPLDYIGDYNMKDTLSTEVDTFRSMGFAACIPLIIVAKPDQWHTRFASNNFSEQEQQARIEEGIGSLLWSLQQGNDVQWLVNPDNKLETTAASVRQLALGRQNPRQEAAKKDGEELLKYLSKL